MSGLILPPGMEPPPPPQEEVPKGILDSLNLLQVGFANDCARILRKRLNDTGTEVAYDIAIAIPHAITGEPRLYVVARIIPQHPKEQPAHESDAAVIRTPAAND